MLSNLIVTNYHRLIELLLWVSLFLLIILGAALGNLLIDSVLAGMAIGLILWLVTAIL